MQVLAELEEVVQYERYSEEGNFKKQKLILNCWNNRLSRCQLTVDVWQRILKLRSMVIEPIVDYKLWINFAMQCRKNKRLHLCYKILEKLLTDGKGSFNDPIDLEQINIRTAQPAIVYGFIKYYWGNPVHDKREVLKYLKRYCEFLSRHVDQFDYEKHFKNFNKNDMISISSRCYHKAGLYELNLQDESDPSCTNHYKTAIDYFLIATTYDKTWHKPWRAWAITNFKLATLTGSRSSNPYIVPAIQGFFKSISLSKCDTLQDCLRLLTCWFKYSFSPEINSVVGDGFNLVPVDNWIAVIPQLIARIHTPMPQMRRLIHHFLNEIGKSHPQALVYPLAVASQSQIISRKTAALAIIEKLRSHSSILIDQALLVGEELIRLAILWEELWHEGLEEASKLYFSEQNITGMFAILEPLHNMIENYTLPISSREATFIKSYGQSLKEARELGLRYKRSGNINELNAAWDIYYQVN